MSAPPAGAADRPALASAAGPPARVCIDVTRTLESGLHSGIQRVVRGLYRGATACAAERDVSVHAVRWLDRQWIDVGVLPTHPLEGTGPARAAQPPARLQPRPGDVLLLADASWYGNPWPAVDGFLRAGGTLAGYVHDLLPLQRPGWFRPGVGARFAAHLAALRARASRLFTGSQHVAAQLAALPGPRLPLHRLPPASSLRDADADAGALRPRGPATAAAGAPFYLSVATLEPRKLHGLLLDAFEAYWRAGGPATLLLVGAPGWCRETLLTRVREHPEQRRRLRWLRDVDDAALAALYHDAQALIYLSRDEGFGLPVLEARQLGCPVIASDRPALREAGGDWPRYLPAADAGALRAALEQPPPRRRALPAARDWADVARELLAALGAGAVRPATGRGGARDGQ